MLSKPGGGEGGQPIHGVIYIIMQDTICQNRRNSYYEVAITGVTRKVMVHSIVRKAD